MLFELFPCSVSLSILKHIPESGCFQATGRKVLKHSHSDTWSRFTCHSECDFLSCDFTVLSLNIFRLCHRNNRLSPSADC